MDTWNAVWKTVMKYSRQRAKKMARGPKTIKKDIYFFQKSSSSPNFSPGYSDCVFDKPAEKFLPKSWHFFTHIPKVMKKSVIFLKHFPQLFLRTRRIHFWQPCPNFFANGPRNFCSKSGSRYVLVFSKKNVSPQNVPMDT